MAIPSFWSIFHLASGKWNSLGFPPASSRYSCSILFCWFFLYPPLNLKMACGLIPSTFFFLSRCSLPSSVFKHHVCFKFVFWILHGDPNHVSNWPVYDVCICSLICQTQNPWFSCTQIKWYKTHWVLKPETERFSLVNPSSLSHWKSTFKTYFKFTCFLHPHCCHPKTSYYNEVWQPSNLIHSCPLQSLLLGINFPSHVLITSKILTGATGSACSGFGWSSLHSLYNSASLLLCSALASTLLLKHTKLFAKLGLMCYTRS